jgi:hypothetical protein
MPPAKNCVVSRCNTNNNDFGGSIENAERSIREMTKLNNMKKGGATRALRKSGAGPHIDREIRDIWHDAAVDILTEVEASMDREAKMKAKNAEYEERIKSFAKPQPANAKEKKKAKYAQPPYDKPESVLKREVYRFVKDNITLKNRSKFEDVILNSSEHSGTLKIIDTEKCYRLIFTALQSKKIRRKNQFTMKPYQITRYVGQLVYADRHDIVPELLIGFLYQTGSTSEICKKAAEEKVYEDWHPLRSGSR